MIILDRTFLCDLVVFDMSLFEIIVDMDWLSLYGVVIDCDLCRIIIFRARHFCALNY